MCERVCGNFFKKMTISQVELGLCEREGKKRINKIKNDLQLQMLLARVGDASNQCYWQKPQAAEKEEKKV